MKNYIIIFNMEENKKTTSATTTTTTTTTTGVSIGCDDEFDMILRVNANNKGPKEVSGAAKSVSIGGGQFDDTDDEPIPHFGGGKAKDMSTDYDPPTRYDYSDDLAARKFSNPYSQ